MLNTIAPRAIAGLQPALQPEIWHQTGARDAKQVAQSYAEHGMNVRVSAFIDDMAAAYAWADLALCRAGALTVSELAAAGLGALLVPFAAAVDDHQTCNAAFLAHAGAAVMLPEAQLTAPALSNSLAALLSDRNRLLDMARRARQRAKTNAAEVVADACVQAGGLA